MPDAYLRARAQAFAASPAGQPPAGPKDFRVWPERWLSQERYDPDCEGEWQRPNGDEPAAAPATRTADPLFPPGWESKIEQRPK